ncbi:MAG TPA: LytTR family DNA-binding domain-containing protein [Gemmatimonadaceae bacterium]|nr:LytTR family DNA-binding domain-containing protein [Gemmatimonadaceae bacterium]
MRVLIVDDEPLARRGVRARLMGMPDVEIAGEADSGLTAVSEIERLRPDVVLLDVQMPELDGFGVIDAIGVDHMPLTIFLTAYDTHAVKAFDANALDYLLKPLDDERFRLAMTRARTRLAEHTQGSHSRQLAAMLAGAAEQRIVLRDGSRVLLFDQQDIDWLGADGDYVRVHAKGRSYLVRHTMAAMEARLDPKQFARVHRSAIVNISRVSEVRRRGDRDHVVVLRDGTKLKVGRAFRDSIADLTLG